MDIKKFEWTRQPQSYYVDEERIEILTSPHTGFVAENILSFSK